MSRVISFLNLAYRFNLHLLRKPFAAAGPPARQTFLANYADDNLHPLSEQGRQQLPRFQRCICCGLCDSVCDNLRATHLHQLGGPSQLASCLSRSLPDYRLLGPVLELWSQCGDCRDCEAVCPSGMPLRELAAFIEAFRAGWSPNP